MINHITYALSKYLRFTKDDAVFDLINSEYFCQRSETITFYLTGELTWITEDYSEIGWTLLFSLSVKLFKSYYSRFLLWIN